MRGVRSSSRQGPVGPCAGAGGLNRRASVRVESLMLYA